MSMESKARGAHTTLRAGRREWAGLAVLALACLVYAMDLTVLHLALPAISAALRPSGAELLWIVDIYGYLVAGSLITIGTLGDRIGRRKLLLLGAAAFGAISILGACATSAPMLIASRALLGIAGATLAPSTLSLIFAIFRDPRERSLAVGVWITAFSAGAAVGPPLGGFLLERFWWGSVFLLSVPVMALLLAIGPRILPEFRDPGAGRPDLPSTALSLVAVLGVVFGVKEVAQRGADPVALLAIGAGLALGVAFARRQLALADPLIDLRLFRAPGFAAALATSVFAFFLVSGSIFFTAQYLQLVLGLSPPLAGLWSLPSACGFIAGAQAAPHLALRIRPSALIGGGLAVAMAGFASLALIDAAGGPAALAGAATLISLGLAPVVTLTTDLIVGAAPPARAGAASGIAETGSELGSALGFSILGSVGLAVYRGRLADHLPATIPPALADPARETLGGAAWVAGQLPADLGVPLLAAARDAFIRGMHLVAVVAAVAALALAILAAVALRHLPPVGARRPAGADRAADTPGVDDRPRPAAAGVAD